MIVRKIKLYIIMYSLLLSCIIMIPACVALGESNEKIDELTNKILGLVKQTYQPFAHKSLEDITKREKDLFKQYIDLLKKLGASTEAPPQEISDLQKELISIAHAYIKSPELLSELIEEYGHWKGNKSSFKRFHSPHPQVLKKKHTKEKYRLIWEALLLAPETKEKRFMEPRIFEALVFFKNSDAAPLLVEVFKNTTLANVIQERKLFSLRKQILYVLCAYIDKKSFEGILLCLDLEDSYYKDKPEKKKYGLYTLREIAFRLLIDPDNKGETEFEKERMNRVKKWKKVINDYSEPIKSEKNKLFLSQLKSFKRTIK